MASGGINKRKADAKVIIMGDYAVGKTSLVSRYIDGKFKPHESTIGAAFFLKQWGPYNVAVWDTAGDEKYTGLSSFYCRNAAAAILAFDLNTASNFESLWTRFLPLLEAAKEDCLKVVVGTKSDLLTETSREISIDECIAFAHEINSELDLSRLKGNPYFETSSKTGYNVANVFEYIFEYCLPLGDGQKQNQFERQRSTVDLETTKTQTSRCCKS